MAGELFMDDTKLDRHVEEVARWRQGKWIAPIHMEVSLANVCNQKCTFCYINWSHAKGLMPADMATDLMRSAKRVGVKSTLIAGEGEPTLNPVYVEAIETCGEVGLDVAFNTNAVRMTEKEIERIMPHLSWVRCSVQGSNPELYTKIHQVDEHHYKKAMKHIAYMATVRDRNNYDVKIGVQQVQLAENAHDAYDLAKLARELGADYYVIKPCHPHELNTNNYAATTGLVEQYRNVLERAQELNTDRFKVMIRWNFLKEASEPRTYHKCLGLPFIIQITAEGDIVTCYPWATEGKHRYGSLRDRSLEDIVRSPEYRATWEWARDNVNVHKCMPTCRQHNANKFLWWLTEESPAHLNFI